MKFRVERDVLADAVAWAARSLPVRPSVPVLAGLLIEAEPTTGWCSRPSTTRPRPGPRSRPRSATRAGRWSAAGCSPTSAAASRQAGRRDPRRVPGLADLWLGPVQPADHAGRGLPGAAGHAGRDRHRAERRVRPRRGQAVTAAGRDDMLPVLTGVRIEIDGSTISLLATDRFRLSHRELDWSPRSPDDIRGRAGPGPGARRHRQVADRAAARSPSRSPPPAPARASSASRARPGGARRTTTRLLDGEFPKVRSLFPSEHLTDRRWSTRPR